MSRKAFTLIELLVVIAILGLLAAILFPVFAHVRENGRRTTCLSNLHQLGLGMQMYAHDNEDTLPGGTHGGRKITLLPVHSRQEPGGDGMGWAGEVYPYVKATAAFACPDDAPVSSEISYIWKNCDGVKISPAAVPVSYGYNRALVVRSFPGGPDPAGKMDRIVQPSGTLLLFEIAGDTVDVTQPDEGASLGYTLFSASGNGMELASAATKPDKQGEIFALTEPGIYYATGRLDGADDRPEGNPVTSDVFPYRAGRHGGGSNFLLADGHAKWLLPGKVCSLGLPVGHSWSECTAHFY
jgi:prepilin-type N-terminal cleavage/methylation domain-containing protein/prepilin-type processing-associated H-X9-DG protein